LGLSFCSLKAINNGNIENKTRTSKLLSLFRVTGRLKLAMLFLGHKQEYRVAEVAVQADLGAGLLSFLEKVKNFEWTPKQSLMGKLYATYPPAMLQIGETEKKIKF
jgi:hypothetical protein